MQPRVPLFQNKWQWMLMALALCLPLRSLAIDLLVYNNSDSGPGSLRQAISDNNTLGGNNNIIFSNGLTGTITLTNGLMSISQNLNLIGPGANVLAVSGNHAGSAFYVTNAVVNISGLTVSNCLSHGLGGGIFNDHATLTISNCTVSGNSAGGGGGMYNNDGSLTIIASTFSGNSVSGSGGGILNTGSLAIIASTFSGNGANSGDGGGIRNSGLGTVNATLTITNCTFSGNSAGLGGAVYNQAGISNAIATLTVMASTFGANFSAGGGGSSIYNDGGSGGLTTLEIGDTILTASPHSAVSIANNSGTVTSDGYNLGGDSGGGFLTNATDRINTDPKISPLQDNGGPTLTMIPLTGSPALDQGNSFGLATDQRGAPRPFDFASITNASGGDGSDIGAVEVGPPVMVVVSNNSDSGAGSLRQAILDADDVAGGTITFAPNVTGMITLTNGQLMVDQNITLIGPGANVLAVSGNHASRVFYITNATASISGLTVCNGIDTNTAFGGGGAGIYNDHSTLTISNCTLIGNSCSNSGGGLYNVLGSNSMVTVIASTISSNSAVSGGGIDNFGTSDNGDATVSVIGSILSGNSATDGGGIYNDGVGGRATLTISNCTLSGNSGNEGGGIYNQGTNAMLTMVASTLIGNSSIEAGGIYNDHAPLMVIASTFSGNSVFSSGGGIYNNAFSGGNAILTISNCTFSGNSSHNGAGGIYNLEGNSTLTIIASTFSGNSAPVGGAIYNDGQGGALGTLAIGDSILNAGSRGINISNSSGTVTSLGYNLSSDSGGGCLTNATDQINTDPMLGPLQDNGGPTFTHALLPNSPAIDQGNGFGLATDQRGAPRPFDFPSIANASGGDGSDIGAFELGQPTLNIQQSNGGVVLSWPSFFGGFTLQSEADITSSSWATVAGTPVVVGNQYVITNSPISTNQFYRLKGN